MTEISFDFEADAKPVPTDAQLSSVASCAMRMVELEDKLARYEVWAKETKALHKAIAEIELPDAMEACGLSEFKLATGQTVVVKPIVAGSIPASDPLPALTWLRDHGHGGLIKRNIAVALERGKDKLGDKVIAQLKKLGVDVTTKDTVHPQTLGAWAREMLADPDKAKGLPLDVLGIYVGRRATVK